MNAGNLKEISELKDKLRRRNMQIKELKGEVKDRIDKTVLSDVLSFHLRNMELEDKIMENVLNR